MNLEPFILKSVERAKRNLGVDRTVNGRRRRSNATGKLQASLEGKQTNTGVDFYGLDYGIYVEEGRSPNSKMPPIDPILNWINNKGIRFREESTPRGRRFANAGRRAVDRAAQQRRLAFRIANSIARNGIPAYPFYSMAIEQSTDKLEDNIEIEIYKIFDGDNGRTTT